MTRMNICLQCDLHGHVDDDDFRKVNVCEVPIKQKVIRYPGDIKRSDFSDPLRSEQAHDAMKKHLKRSNTRNHHLVVKLRRANAQISKFTKDYKSVAGSVDRQLEVILNNMPMLLKTLITNPKNGNRFREEVRQFCLGLHYHSPAGYEFVRRELFKELPGESTLRAWYHGLDGKPGICQEAILTIKQNTSFRKPESDEMMHIVIHMIKLVRNTYANRGTLYDYRGEEIKFDYIEELEKYQDKIGLRLGNKLTKAHVKFQKNKMKTKFVVQTLSISVADALEYLKDEAIPEFLGCESTVEFIRLFNNLFDILNSKSKFSKEFKRPTCNETVEEFFQFFDYARKYITQLSVKVKEETVYVLDSIWFTGFLRFLVDMETLKSLYFIYVRTENPYLDYILFYKFSQDYLEQIFSLIRARGGFNDNPSTIDFSAAFKWLLVHNQLRLTREGNTLPQDATCLAVLHVTSARKVLNQGFEDPSIEESCDVLSTDLLELNVVEENVIMYIAGYVEKRIFKLVKCEACLNALNSDNVCYSKLIKQKNRGQFGLIEPQKEVYLICKIGEQVLRKFIPDIENEKMNNPMKIQTATVFLIFEDYPNIFDSLKEHTQENGLLENHKIDLVKLIVQIFIVLRIHHVCTRINAASMNENLRQFSKKMVLFAGL